MPGQGAKLSGDVHASGTISTKRTGQPERPWTFKVKGKSINNLTLQSDVGGPKIMKDTEEGL